MNQITQYVNKFNDFLLPGELEPYLLIYAQHLSEQGYTNLSVRGYIDSVSHFGTWLTINEVSIKDIDVEVVERFAKHRCHCPGSRKKTFVSIKYANRVRKFIVFVCKHGGIPSYTPLEHSLPIPNAHFCEFLKYRGLLSITVKHYSDSINVILPLLGQESQDYDAKNIKRTVLQLSKQYSLARLKSLTTALRSYLRFLAVKGLCAPDLDRAVPAVANWSLSSIPKYIVAEEIEQVINSCDIKTPKGLRDRAIILLLSRIGLRAGDIVDMKLDHIDWHNGSVRLLGKMNREDCLPLPQDAGDAILDYIENARPPVKIAEIFLCINAPHRPFSSSAAVSSLVASAIKRSGIATPASCGAHLLRHSAATQMLRTGATLETVSSILRHRSLDMTAYYAKVDIPMLETIMQPWPARVTSC
ncbi:tyrosine-type recombinase/integrase [Colwellia sp. MSW7]|uniref:Tyrosine-type recombinase/integrase n=1 Tax=Colwellia maritima TaxID=2912588 RepID=A0ABS9X7A9_9GAMM|nr:tyrosine-type recombinase/integrase [Colwellia maritima]MCI2286108.1 tyrosine-type recombinase/integrase [Colwellia maritima]